MGIYLSTPNTDANIETGAGAGLEFSVGEMQGWRKNMEDAHIAVPNLLDESKTSQTVSLFGVFDGHGGKEVAKFTKIKFADVLLSLPSFQQGQYSQALKESFHKIDTLLEDPCYDSLLKELRALPNPSDLAQQRKKEQQSQALAKIKQAQTEKEKETDNSMALVVAPQQNQETQKDKEVDDDKNDEDDDDDDDPLSNAEAVRLIRELLLGKKREKEEQKEKEKVKEKETERVTSGTTPSTILSDEDEVSESTSNISISRTQQHTLSPSIAAIEERERAKDDEHTHFLPSEVKDAPVKVLPPPQPAAIQNTQGQWVCNLKDHRIPAGCTAIVGLVVQEREKETEKETKKLIVANAGDSRGVLSRSGQAVALSEDHKPQDARESDRIKAAGGFVNAVGRINGNLNLSRALGDLKYKALKHLPVEAQIITAEPDIRVFPLSLSESGTEVDEFFVFGCDGIWDVMSNQNAVDFVRNRLLSLDNTTPDSPVKSLQEITQEALNFCLAEDPRQSQGIGGDNMTFLVVSLQPMSYWMSLRESLRAKQMEEPGLDEIVEDMIVNAMENSSI